MQTDRPTSWQIKCAFNFMLENRPEPVGSKISGIATSGTSTNANRSSYVMANQVRIQFRAGKQTRTSGIENFTHCHIRHVHQYKQIVLRHGKSSAHSISLSVVICDRITKLLS